jgi:CHAT domain-containing protein
VKAALKDCDVAHFAVHCLVEEKSPWLAALVLAGETRSQNASGQSSTDNGLLFLNEVYNTDLQRTRLVVLSACQSGLGRYYKGEGIVSLVRPFLALRVPTVVASLWSVDSKATATLMVEFHRNRKTGFPGAGDALRAAQIKMAGSTLYHHPYYWAPFIAVGSND